MKNIENRVAETILQRPKTVVVGGVSYEVAPPSTATIIRISEMLPTDFDIDMQPKHMLKETLRIAKRCRFLGDIAACLILGFDEVKEIKVVKEKRFFGLVTYERKIVIDKKAELANKCISMGPAWLDNLYADLLDMEIGSFFGLTTFLIGVNLLKPTKTGKVVKTTASGQ